MLGKFYERSSRVKTANTGRMIKDDRARQKEYNSIFDVGESADRLG